MVSGVLNLSFAFKESQYPPIASGYWIAVCIAQEINAVFHCFEIFLLTKVPIGLRVIEYKTCAADQVAGDGIIDGTVVLEKVVKTSPRIDGTGVVESHGLPDVVQQEIAVAEVG
jgi:hypothetical protein